MANLDHLGKLNEGVAVWNRWRSENPQVAVSLSEAELEGKDLSGADLRGASLEHANLRGAKLGHGTLLWSANLCYADLYQANLRGAELQHANFTGTDLFKANLREANLRGSDLSGANGGVETEQLAGADLTDAKLPEQLKKLYEDLGNVKSISESARRLFLAVLGACLYCWLTIATTLDVNLITNRASSPLPIIQTSIPIVGFYVVAPLLLLCIYFYFHFYLQKLWEELESLPAVLPDGRPLHAKVDPWLLNDLVRSHLVKLNVDRPFLSYFQQCISVVMAWWAVPITVLLFWGRYLRRHEEIGTAYHVVLLVIALVSAVCLYRLAIATLRGAERKPFTWKAALTSRRGYLTATSAFVVGVLFGLVSLGAFRGVRSGRPILGVWRSSEAPWSSLPFDENRKPEPETWVPRAMAVIGYPPFANLTDAEVSQKKSTWNQKNDSDPDFVMGVQLSRANLRYVSADRAFFVGADLSGADLSGADLKGADLTGAEFGGAILNGAWSPGAHLGGADLGFADLSNADLGNADLSNAKLNNTELTSASLIGANLQGASLEHANLTGAMLQGADLSSAKLNEANLTYSDFRTVPGVNAKMDPEAVKRALHWEKAFYDCKIIEALDLPLDNSVKLYKQLLKDIRDNEYQPKMIGAPPAPCLSNQ